MPPNVVVGSHRHALSFAERSAVNTPTKIHVLTTNFPRPYVLIIYNFLGSGSLTNQEVKRDIALKLWLIHLKFSCLYKCAVYNLHWVMSLLRAQLVVYHTSMGYAFRDRLYKQTLKNYDQFINLAASNLFGPASPRNNMCFTDCVFSSLLNYLLLFCARKEINFVLCKRCSSQMKPVLSRPFQLNYFFSLYKQM